MLVLKLKPYLEPLFLVRFGKMRKILFVLNSTFSIFLFMQIMCKICIETKRSGVRARLGILNAEMG